jgi:UDP-N-acetylglucosamine 2-epimerase (non-hydrolysing)
MKIMTVVGARPNFMKAAPIIKAIGEFNAGAGKPSKKHQAASGAPSIQHVLVHTGQHYDAIMSDTFFEELQMPKPDIHLGVGGGPHGAQTGEILRKFEEVLKQERPDVLIVVGDVNSTAACALAAVKLPTDNGEKRPLVAHVESGLRSFDRTMPEEHNRVVTDHLADLLFVTEPSGVKNLKREGIPAQRVHFVGNTMIDTLLAYQAKADTSPLLSRLGLRASHASNGVPPVAAPYALLTLHRPANVDNAEAFRGIIEGIAELSKHMRIIFPAHPRTMKRVEEFGLSEHFVNGTSLDSNAERAAAPGRGILMVPPCGYLDFVCLMKNARLVITDSGGIQEETTCLGVPCVTVRENTERPVTITSGTNILAGVKPAGIRKAIRKQLAKRPRGKVPAKWDGKSAQRIVRALYQAAK